MGRISKATYADLLDKVRNRLAGWKARNGAIFYHSPPHPVEVIANANRTWLEYLRAVLPEDNSPASNPDPSHPQASVWTPRGGLKIHRDASFNLRLGGNSILLELSSGIPKERLATLNGSARLPRCKGRLWLCVKLVSWQKKL